MSMASKQAKTKAVTKAVKAALTVTQAQRVASIIKLASDAIATTETKRTEIEAILLKEFPTVATVKDRTHYKPIASAIRTDSENGWAYEVFREWIVKTYKGLPNKDGVIQTAAMIARNKKSGKGMTAGRFLNAWLSKCKACVTYLDSCPGELIEPAMLAEITAVVSTLSEHMTKVEEYKDNEAATAEADKPSKAA
jgi:hypothetical protein